jgi:hypothetical protein
LSAETPVKEKRPFKSVVVERLPSKVTTAPGRAMFASSTAWPLMLLWAMADKLLKANAKSAIIFFHN